MTSQDLPKPDYANNMKLIGYSDQGGRPDGVQLMVNKGYAIIGHMFSKGFSVVDVRDPGIPNPQITCLRRKIPGTFIYRAMAICFW